MNIKLSSDNFTMIDYELVNNQHMQFAKFAQAKGFDYFTLQIENAWTVLKDFISRRTTFTEAHFFWSNREIVEVLNEQAEAIQKIHQKIKDDPQEGESPIEQRKKLNRLTLSISMAFEACLSIQINKEKLEKQNKVINDIKIALKSETLKSQNDISPKKFSANIPSLPASPEITSILITSIKQNSEEVQIKSEQEKIAAQEQQISPELEKQVGKPEQTFFLKGKMKKKVEGLSFRKIGKVAFFVFAVLAGGAWIRNQGFPLHRQMEYISAEDIDLSRNLSSSQWYKDDLISTEDNHPKVSNFPASTTQSQTNALGFEEHFELTSQFKNNLNPQQPNISISSERGPLLEPTQIENQEQPKSIEQPLDNQAATKKELTEQDLENSNQLDSPQQLEPENQISIKKESIELLVSENQEQPKSIEQPLDNRSATKNELTEQELENPNQLDSPQQLEPENQPPIKKDSIEPLVSENQEQPKSIEQPETRTQVASRYYFPAALLVVVFSGVAAAKHYLRKKNPLATNFSELPCPPKPSGEPKWNQRDAFEKDDLRYEALDLKTKKYNKFLKNLPDGPFKKYFQDNSDILKNKTQCFTSSNRSHPYIYQPNTNALQKIALKYYEKYGVLIRTASLNSSSINSLDSVLEELDKAIEGPQYAGIFVDEGEFLHALPLICFFGQRDPQTKQRMRQFLIADVLASSSLQRMVLNILKKLPQSELFVYKGHMRQVDSGSCRTGAMQLLKHSLISLKDGMCVEGLTNFLKKNAQFEKDITTSEYIEINTLPPTFNYSEQIYNKNFNNQVTIFRDKYSKQKKKAAAPRTITKHRKDYTEIIKFNCEIDFGPMSAAELPEAPPNVTVSIYGLNKNYYNISFSEKISINTYLAKKGKKQSETFDISLKNDQIDT